MRNSMFDIKRFGALMNWMYRACGNTMMRLFGTCFVLVVIGEFMFMPMTNTSDGVDSTMSLFHVGFVCLVAAQCGSFMGNTSVDRRARLTMLMLPATTLEKFVARVLWAVGGGALVVLAAVVAGDTVRWVLCQSLGWMKYRGWGVPVFFAQFFSDEVSGNTLVRIDGLEENVSGVDAAVTVLGKTVWLWVCSVFMVFGILLRRMRVAIAFVVLFVLFWMWAFGVACFVSKYEDLFMQMLYNSVALCYGAAAVVTAVAVFNVWLSYRMFCRLQIVSGKWINV